MKDHRQVVKCEARNPCYAMFNNKTPKGVTETFAFFLSPPSGLGLLLNSMQGFRYASPPACGLSSFQDLLNLHKRKCVMLSLGM